jgi:hypothetical protein
VRKYIHDCIKLGLKINYDKYLPAAADFDELIALIDMTQLAD